MFYLQSSRCPICGKEFYPRGMWAYKDQTRKPYCSWKCLQVKYRADEAKRKAAAQAKQLNRVYKKIAQYTLDGELVAVYESAMLAADAVNGIYNGIYNACREGKKYKNHIKF